MAGLVVVRRPARARSVDRTANCIAVIDEVIGEIVRAVPDGTPIEILRHPGA